MAHLSLPPGPFPPGREVVPLELSLETWGILEYGWVPGGWVFSLPSSPCPTVWSQVPEGPLCPPAPGPCRLTELGAAGVGSQERGKGGSPHTQEPHLQGLDAAGDEVRHHAHLGPLLRVPRQESRRGPGLLQILDDGQLSREEQ